MDIFLGTQLKLNIHIDPIGPNNMSTYDWSVDVYTNPKKFITINKDEARKNGEEGNDYMIIVDTDKIGLGDLRCKVIAYLKDGDFEDDDATFTRKEVVIVDPNITIINNI